MIKSDRSGKEWVKFTLLAAVMLLASDLSAKEKSNYENLPSGDGVDLVLENCTACHSTEIIRKNYMSREAWDKTITWMQQKQGLWELGEINRKIILDYLAKAQGISANKDKSVRKQTNPMYEFDYRANPL
tara:strand:- start:157 stop:546 length:390 start_codon:yes stop_codon:yes gene_type:complete